VKFLPLIIAAMILAPCVIAAPDRAQFIRECLDATATRETPKFDDYTHGSYHVDKLDLIEGLEAATRSQPGRLRAVIIVGPTGPLWTYYVLVALSEGDGIRLNSIVMPHARITGKGTRTFTKTEFDQLFNKVAASKLLHEGEPPTDKTSGSLARDFAYDCIVVSWSDGRRLIRFAKLENSDDNTSAKDAEALSADVNALLKGDKTTYPKERAKDNSTKS
jgi:hypothetical protein